MRAEFNLDAIKAANPIAAVIGRDLALKESSRGEFTACGVRQDAAIGGTFGTGLVSLGAGYDGANATAKWNGNCSELLVYFAALSSADLAAIWNHQKALLWHAIGGVSRTSRHATGCPERRPDERAVGADLGGGVREALRGRGRDLEPLRALGPPDSRAPPGQPGDQRAA